MSVDYSIVIPAYNEAAYLSRTLAAVKAAMARVDLVGEIVVCNNNSNDDTAALAESLGARVVFETHNQISRARNTGGRDARGRFLVFVDADTLISPELLNGALSRLASGDCCGGGSVVEADKSLKPAVRKLLDCWTYLSVKFRLAAGCFVFCLREDFDAVGGFSEAVYAGEEIWFSRALFRRGKKRGQYFCVIADYPVITSCRKTTWFSVWQQWLVLVMLFVFPFLVRWRRFCGFWYKRPSQ